MAPTSAKQSKSNSIYNQVLVEFPQFARAFDDFCIEEYLDLTILTLVDLPTPWIQEMLHPICEPVEELIGRLGCRSLIIDCKHSKYLGSEVITMLFRLWDHVRRNEGKMVLCNVRGILQEVLRITRIDSLFPIFSDRAAALSAIRNSTAE